MSTDNKKLAEIVLIDKDWDQLKQLLTEDLTASNIDQLVSLISALDQYWQNAENKVFAYLPIQQPCDITGDKIERKDWMNTTDYQELIADIPELYNKLALIVQRQLVLINQYNEQEIIKYAEKDA